MGNKRKPTDPYPCDKQEWGWLNVKPQQWSVERLREAIRELEASASARGYPAEYVCTHATWETIKQAAERTHMQGIGKKTLDRVCGVPVRCFDTVAECINYISAKKIADVKVQLLR